MYLIWLIWCSVGKVALVECICQMHFIFKRLGSKVFFPQSLATDMRRLFYSTWPPSFSSHIKKGEESDDGHRIKRALYIGIKRLWFFHCQRLPSVCLFVSLSISLSEWDSGGKLYGPDCFTSNFGTTVGSLNADILRYNADNLSITLKLWGKLDENVSWVNTFPSHSPISLHFTRQSIAYRVTTVSVLATAPML